MSFWKIQYLRLQDGKALAGLKKKRQECVQRYVYYECVWRQECYKENY